MESKSAPSEVFLETVVLNVLEVTEVSKEHNLKITSLPTWIVKIDKKRYDYLRERYNGVVYRNGINSLSSIRQKPEVGDNMLFELTERKYPGRKYVNMQYIGKAEGDGKKDKFSSQADNIIAQAKKYYDISTAMNNETLSGIDFTEKIREITHDLIIMIEDMENIYKECVHPS